jgi:hypothetical protein
MLFVWFLSHLLSLCQSGTKQVTGTVSIKEWPEGPAAML